MSSQQDNVNSGHKRTKRVSATECDIYEPKEDEVDPVVEKLTKIGCLEKHYSVQDCYFETKGIMKTLNKL